MIISYSRSTSENGSWWSITICLSRENANECSTNIFEAPPFEEQLKSSEVKVHHWTRIFKVSRTRSMNIRDKIEQWILDEKDQEIIDRGN